MAGFILGEKSEQTQTFDDSGLRIPTTFIKTAPCYLVEIKEPPKHKYFSVMLGFGNTKNISKPNEGKLKKAGIKSPLRFLKEFRINSKEEIAVVAGQEVKPALFFKKGDLVDITGVSKGKGFQGGVKRHHFRGGSRTHGQSDRERAPGSIGQTTTPGRVYKGKRMAGRMGGERIKVKKLMIVDVKDDGILIKGLVPGARGGLLEITNLKYHNSK